MREEQIIHSGWKPFYQKSKAVLVSESTVSPEAVSIVRASHAGAVRFVRHLPFLALLFLAGTIPFLPATIGDFVWVDHAEIEQRGYLVLNQEDFRDVWRMTLEQYMSRGSSEVSGNGGYFRPLYALGITASYRIYGLNPIAFHLENLLWHVIVVWGLYVVGLRWGATRAATLVAAGCFAVHPLTVTSVSWISGRKDLMCAAFGVWAVIAAMQVVTSRKIAWQILWTMLAFILAAASVLSKELGVVVPVAALLAVCRLHWRSDETDAEHAIGRINWPPARPLRAIPALLAMSVPAGFMIGYRTTFLGGLGLNARYPHDSWWANVVTSCQLHWSYVGRVLLPRDPRVSDAWIVELPSLPIQVVLVLATAILVIVGIIGLVRRKAFAAPLLWWLIWLLPAMGMIPLRHLYAERYLYPASWGILAAAWFMAREFLYQYPQQPVSWNSPSLSQTERTAQEKIRENSIYLLGGLLILVIGLQTALANRYWIDDQTLFEHAVERDPNYLEGRVALSSRALFDNDLEVAIDQGEEVLRRSGAETDLIAYWSPYIARTNLGLAYLRSGRAADAVTQFKVIKQQWPDDSPTDFHLGQAFLANGQPELAQLAFERRLQTVPDDFGAKSNLALAYLFQQRFDEAIARLEPLVAARPDDVTNRVNLANAYMANRQFDQAYGLLAELFAERKEDPVVIAKLAFVLLELGQLPRAEQVIVHGLRVAPNHPLIRTNAERIKEAIKNMRDLEQ